MMESEKHQGFIAEKPISELLPVEALALVNRWAKVKNRFYYDDLDQIYSIKDDKIKEWLKSGEVIATKIITRESPAFQGMRKAIANDGKDLAWLNYNSWYDYLSEKEDDNYRFLHNLTGAGCDEFYVPYPEDIYNFWLEELKPKIDEYNSAFETYQIESNRRQPFTEEYNRQVREHKQAEEKAAKAWAKESNIKIARSNSGKNIRKNWLKRLKKQGFKFSISKPRKPFPQKLQAPQKVEYPDRNYLVTWETYLPGSLPEVEEVLEWTRKILGYNVNSWDINEDFACIQFDEAIAEYILERLKPDVLAVFKDILTGNLTAKEAHKQLTSFEVDFEETIGMKYWYSYDRACQGDYSKWHEINLSPTGTWLIEFQSAINPDITFHSPYSRDFGLDKSSLPKVDSTQKNFGREINSGEKKDYPIEELIKILGFEISNFFCELRQYRPQRRAINYDYNWEEDDDDFF